MDRNTNNNNNTREINHIMNNINHQTVQIKNAYNTIISPSTIRQNITKRIKTDNYGIEIKLKNVFNIATVKN